MGAVPQAVAFIIGIILAFVFGVPDVTGIGSMILDAFSDALCTGSENPACSYVPIFQGLFFLVGVLFIVASVLSIWSKAKQGKYF